MSSLAPIRLGMVGGGQDAFIGAVHRIAARLDGHFNLVAGALSSDPQRAAASAAALGIAADRSYPNFAQMAQAEAARPDGIEAVAIVTPNHLHFAAAKAFLEAGIEVICEKPITSTLAEAKTLADLVAHTGRLFIVTHNYTGYPMVREARARVKDGWIGALRLVQVEYVQGWLAETVETTSKQAAWRTNPALAGAGGALGDIGSHAYNLAAVVCGQEPTSILADLSRFGAGRQLDDNASVLMRYDSGARGTLWASQVAVGCDNGLRLRLYGDKGGLEWFQEDSNTLLLESVGEPRRTIKTNGAGAGPQSRAVSRVPAGHPEGFLEAFATIYVEAAAAIRARRRGAAEAERLSPSIEDGLRTMMFIDACLRSDAAGASWVTL